MNTYLVKTEIRTKTKRTWHTLTTFIVEAENISEAIPLVSNSFGFDTIGYVRSVEVLPETLILKAKAKA